MLRPPAWPHLFVALIMLISQFVYGQFLSMVYEGTVYWNSTSSPQLELFRPVRSISDSDTGKGESKPELEASHKQNHTVLKCSVREPRPNADVYVSCPALGGSVVTSACYQGCRPTKPCTTVGESREPCVPNEQSVFCQKSHFPNGTIVLTLLLSRTDPRLAGVWFCSHTGLESTKFVVALENSSSAQKQDLEAKQLEPTSEETHTVAQMRKPLVVFGVLAVLALSLLANMIFCTRCLLLRSYIDATQENGKHLNCLARCLCLSKEVRNASETPKSPQLPKSVNWTPLYGQSDLQHASAQLVYPLTVGQRSPVLMSSQPSMNFSPIHGLSSASLPGTLRRYGQTRGAIFLPSTEGPQSPRISCDQLIDGSVILPPQIYLGTSSTYLPSYIRVPSVNAPTPDLSQRLLSTSETESLSKVQYHNPGTAGDIEGAPRYVFQMQPPAVRNQVVYDDVAAGNTSIIGRCDRSPNGTMVDTCYPSFHLSNHYPLYSTKAYHFSNQASTTELSKQPSSLDNESRFQHVSDAQLEVGQQERKQDRYEQQEHSYSGRHPGVSSEKSPLLQKLDGNPDKKPKFDS